MEDALRVVIEATFSSSGKRVLILVLMEDALRVDIKGSSTQALLVLILVLMEDALRVKRFLIGSSLIRLS